jgi:hypothetical protein
VLAEQEQAEQAGRERIEDGEARLGCGQRARGQRVRRQQEADRTRADQDVEASAAQDRAGALPQVGAELFDHRSDEAPGDPR